MVGRDCLFLRVSLTRILGDRFRAQHVTDELASQLVQLVGARAPDRLERSWDDARGNDDDWDAVLALFKRPAGSGGHPEDLRCDEGHAFVEDGITSLFEPVHHACGVELQDLAHENETSAESASST